MLKLPDKKTRKGLRITQCVLYLIQIFLCTMTYVRIPNPEGLDSSTPYVYKTVFDMIGLIGGTFSGDPTASELSAIQSYLPLYLIFIIVPVVGFFFCALDKYRNLKNFVSLGCCLVGVVAILTVVSIQFIDFGSTLALLLYLVISFITTVAMMARLNKDDDEEEKKPKKKKLSKYEREY